MTDHEPAIDTKASDWVYAWEAAVPGPVNSSHGSRASPGTASSFTAARPRVFLPSDY